MVLDFAKGDIVSHLYFGRGIVVDRHVGSYAIQFADGYRVICEDHSALKPGGYQWQEKELDMAARYLKTQQRKQESTWTKKFL